MESLIVGIREYGLRVDGRTMNEYRGLRIKLNKNYGEVEISIGRTHVLCIVKSELSTPNPDRGSEGFISFSVDLGPLSVNPISHEYRYNRNSMGAEIGNYVEKTLRESGAIDTEVLCIMSGICTWSVKCELHVLYNDGNLIDACLLASIAGFKHYKFVDIDLVSFLEKSNLEGINNIDIDRLESTIKRMEMLPFNIHHFPLSVTIGYLNCKDELTYVVDPTIDEESVIETSIHIAINERNEICRISKFGGAKISENQLKHAIQLATMHSQKIHQELKDTFDSEKLNKSEVIQNNKVDKELIHSLEINSNSQFKVLFNIEKSPFNEKEITVSRNSEEDSVTCKSRTVVKSELKEPEHLNGSSSPSEGIRKTLEQVQLDKIDSNSSELLNALKPNFILKKRKKS
ncbi:polymyositis/scleroderma autoantigen 1 [Cryptosporidium ryanae]|uniref:polymyositis/scleroderma autoantigen 1 n=1 Tax=Cryptosporidium ryanae TaxID=515981 RepID=UPI00351A633F|nr:polymyositis/scleroderma autoantigen 1 [Cryptosporidium ryanae]